jgi:hypothetical protein
VKSTELEISLQARDHITPGQYPAFSRSAKVYRDGMFKRWTCLVNFDVLADDSFSVIARLGWFLNLGRGEKPNAGHRSKFWAAWIAANGASPKRGDRMSANIFRNRHATIIVRDTERDFRGVTSGGLYSVVETVTAWNTGGVR